MARRKGKLSEQQEEQEQRVRLGKVVGIDSAPSRQGVGQGVGGGRPSGLGYDPSTGEVYRGKSKMRGDAEHDVFALVDERGYRADRFYTNSTDKNGHGEKMSFRLPQGIDSQIHAAVREIPEYASTQAFIRDALLHRLEYIQKHYQLSDNARRFVELERIQADMERMTSEIETMTNAVERMKLGLETAYASRDWGLMKEAMDVGDEMMEWMREPYRGRVEATVREWRARVRDDLTKWERERQMESGEE